MTPADLADLFRSDVDDTDANDPLWSDDEVYSYMDRSQKKFARETDYFSDSSTAEIVQLTVTADDPVLTLNPRVTKIRSARLLSTGRQLTPKKYQDVENDGYGDNDYDSYATFTTTNWEDSTGNPIILITDWENEKVRLVPIPTVNDTVNLRVYRLPLVDITEDTPSFEITELEYQTGLLYWMKHLAYLKNDADVFNLQLSEEGRRLATMFMDDADRNIQRLRAGSTVGAVRYGGL
jgi:hypothetical protein